MEAALDKRTTRRSTTPWAPGPRCAPCALARRAVTVTELLVVLMLIGVLTSTSTTLYVRSRKAGDLTSDARKIQKALATARSYAISSEDHYFQVTFWNDEPWQPGGAAYWYWIDEIAACDLADTATPAAILRPKITTPEPLNLQVVAPHDSVASAHPRFVGGVANAAMNTISLRFCPDGTSDDGSVYLIRKEANRSDGRAYQRVRLYGPTARARVFENQPAP